MVPNNSLEQARPSGWRGWMTALLPPSHSQGFGCHDCSEVEVREGTFAIFWTLWVQTGAGCVCMCVRVFTLHANLDVPIVAQTSWCCRRSSQKLFSSVVKFNFDVFLCHRMCSLPSCWGRPSCAALAGPRGRQSCISAMYPLTDFMKRAQASFPPSPSLSFPSPWTMHFPNRDAFPWFISKPKGPRGQVLKKSKISNQRTWQTPVNSCPVIQPTSI